MGKLNAKCKHCGHPFAFEVNEQMAGKTIMVTCPNPSCGAKMRIQLREKAINLPPQHEGKNETVIRNPGDKDRTLCLSVLPNAFTEAQQFMLDAEYNSVGRKSNRGPELQPDIMIITGDKTVSGLHALIQKKRNGLFSVKNLKGKNNTYLNGKQLVEGEELYIGTGDIIRLGSNLCIKVTLK